MVAGILAGMALPSLTSYMSRQEVRRAGDAFALAAARARSAAVARADLVRLTVDPEAEVIQVIVRTDSVLHSVDLAGPDGAAKIIALSGVGPDGKLQVLYTPRGFVDPVKEDGGLLPVQIGFARGKYEVWMRMTVVGHVERER